MMPINTGAAPPVRRGPAFGVSGGDAEDYYDTIMSSDEEGESSDVELETMRNTEANRAILPATITPSASSSRSSSTAVMTHIGSISYASDGNSSAATMSRSVLAVSSDDEFKLTESELEIHSKRRSALEIALDVLSHTATATAMTTSSAGEAPFRFALQRDARITSPAPAMAAKPVAGHAPYQSDTAKRKKGIPLGGSGIREEEQHDDDGDSSSSDDDDENANRMPSSEPDPLYDDEKDDADEKWVQTHLRSGSNAALGGGVATDATLCCPCCFVTVCMDCQRHVKYHNQYRARVAMNCRVQKDTILTYSSSQNGPLQPTATAATKETRAGRVVLGSDEYFGVVCSDCGTTVGVYDNQQTYHFFNILPSNC